MSARSAVLSLFALAACGVNEDNWGEKNARVECEYMERCAALEFFYLYDDQGECIDKKLDYWDEYGEQVVQGCKFDEEAANECHKLLGQSCETIVDDMDDVTEACAEAWNCDNLYGGG